MNSHYSLIVPILAATSNGWNVGIGLRTESEELMLTLAGALQSINLGDPVPTHGVKIQFGPRPSGVEGNPVLRCLI